MKKVTAILFFIALFAAPALCATPSEWYKLDGDSGEIYFRGKRVANLTDLKGVDDTVCNWMQTKIPEPSVWVFNGYVPEEVDFFPIEDDEECVNIFMPNEELVMILELMSARKQYSTLAVYSLKGERLYETPGRSPIFWIDGRRCLFTSFVPGKRRGKNIDAPLWTGAKVLEIIGDGNGGESKTFDIDVKSVAEPNAVADYTAEGVENDECILTRTRVKSPRRWNDSTTNATKTIIRRPVPAAG